MRSQSFYLSIFFTLLASAKHVQYELNSGEVELLEPSEVHEVHAPDDGSPILGRMSARDLFARQYCSSPGENVICGAGCCPNNNFCCESTSCIDTTQRICCQGGRQCPFGGDCCLDGSCCWAGTYCVKNLDTGVVGCRSYSGSGGSSGGGSSSAAASTTSFTSTTPPPTSVTAPPAPTSTSYTCDNPDYSLCADQRFCCPFEDYCYYDSVGNPKCWDGLYYYWYFYFYWYYEEYTTTLWFTTSTSWSLDDFSTVFTLPTTPPTPTVAPPTYLAIVPPSDTSDLLGGSSPTATAGPNVAGSLPNGAQELSTPTLPEATLLATYTGKGGGLASDASSSSSETAETFAGGTGASTASGVSSSSSSRGVRRTEMMWGKEAILGATGVVGVFLGAVLL